MPTARRSALQPILDRNLLTRLLHRRGRAQLPGCNLGVLPEDGIDLSQWVSVHGEPSKPRDQLSLDLHTLTKRGLISSTTFPEDPFFARSSPMVVILFMDGPLLVIRLQRSLYGT